MTSEQKRLKAIARKLYPEATAIRHIHPHAYCIAKPAQWCAVFAIPPQDRGPSLLDTPNVTIHNKSVADVKLGDWCGTAYVFRRNSGENHVIARYLP